MEDEIKRAGPELPEGMSFGILCKSDDNNFITWFATRDYAEASALASCITTNKNCLIKAKKPKVNQELVMGVQMYSFINQGCETIYVTSDCGKYGVDIDCLAGDVFHCQPTGCFKEMARVFLNREEAITFADNWCSIT